MGASIWFSSSPNFPAEGSGFPPGARQFSCGFALRRCCAKAAPMQRISANGRRRAAIGERLELLRRAIIRHHFVEDCAQPAHQQNEQQTVHLLPPCKQLSHFVTRHAATPIFVPCALGNVQRCKGIEAKSFFFFAFQRSSLLNSFRLKVNSAYR